MGERICTVPDCGKKLLARGLCAMHYERLKRSGGINKTPCSFDGCETGQYAHGLCFIHWQRQKRHGDPSVDLRPVLKVPAVERFHSKYEVADDGCWLWTATLGHTGYAIFHIESRDALAHRWAYEQFVGPVPDGLELDHLCHTRDGTCPGGTSCCHRRCVNPEHLEPVTARENVRRGKSFAAVHAAKTHCVNGHLFDEENTLVLGDGGRRCKACRREISRRWWAKRSTKKVEA